MPSQLTPSYQLLTSSWKMMKERWNDVWIWLAGLAVVQFAIVWMSQSLASGFKANSYSADSATAVIQSYSGWYWLAVIGMVLLSVGLIRLLLIKAMPGAKIRGYWMSILFLIAGGIVSAVIVGIASIFLIIPGIWLAIAFTFASLEIISNDKGPISSLSSSFELVKGRWWATFGRILMLIVYVFVFEIALTIVFALVTVVARLAGPTVGLVVGGLVRAPIAVAVSYFAVCWQVNLYKSEKATYKPQPKA